MNTTNHYILNCRNTLLLTYSLSTRNMQVINGLEGEALGMESRPLIIATVITVAGAGGDMGVRMQLL